MIFRIALAATLLAGTAAAQLITPVWRGEAQTEHALWDVFTHAKLSPNVPDVVRDLPSNNARLICTTSSAFLTSGGNIYSFTAPIACQITDNAGFPIRSVFLQVVTLGSGLNTDTVRIVATNGSGNPYFAYPAHQFIVDQQALGGEFGGSGTTYAFQWDFTSLPQTAVYTIQFTAAASSASLDQVSLDTSSAYLKVGEPLAPVLSIRCESDRIVLSWPLNSPAGTVLQHAPTLDDPEGWQPVGQTPVSSGDSRRVTLPLAPDPSFFRLNY